MDGRRFDNLARSMAVQRTRRGFFRGLIGTGLAAAGVGKLAKFEADAQVTQVYCGNQACASNPGGCKPGCVCCTYTNAVGQVTNSRCRPPGTCSPGTTTCPAGKFVGPGGGCVDCLSAANCPGNGNPCQSTACVNGTCQSQVIGNGQACGSSGECSSKVCDNGQCVDQSGNEGQSCGGGGTACNPTVCRSGVCTPEPETVNGFDCPGGLCFGGQCCQGATDDGFCSVEFQTCCQDAPCCAPNACCVECFIDPETAANGGPAMCCPPASLCPLGDPNAPRCCYFGETCIEGACIDDRRICGGAVCDGDCCGTDCCEDGQYCKSGEGCIAIPTNECTSDAECSAELQCVGIIEGVGSGGVFIVTAGSCCPDNRVCPSLAYDGPGNGVPAEYCLPYGLRCGANGIDCDNAFFIACGGQCDNCSPRGGRTRL